MERRKTQSNHNFAADTNFFHPGDCLIFIPQLNKTKKNEFKSICYELVLRACIVLSNVSMLSSLNFMVYVYAKLSKLPIAPCFFANSVQHLSHDNTYHFANNPLKIVKIACRSCIYPQTIHAEVLVVLLIGPYHRSTDTKERERDGVGGRCVRRWC